jgi:hypothetical protein
VADLEDESILSFVLLFQKVRRLFPRNPMKIFNMKFGSSLDKDVFFVFVTGIDNIFRRILSETKRRKQNIEKLIWNTRSVSEETAMRSKMRPHVSYGMDLRL